MSQRPASKAAARCGEPTATATLDEGFLPERVVVKQGGTTTEFTYGNYQDFNNPLHRIWALYAGTIVERQNGKVVRDLKTKQTEIGQVYVVIPVPESVQKAFPAARGERPVLARVSLAADAASAAANGARVRISRPKAAAAAIATRRTIGAGSISRPIGDLSLRRGARDTPPRDECLALVQGNRLAGRGGPHGGVEHQLRSEIGRAHV